MAKCSCVQEWIGRSNREVNKKEYVRYQWAAFLVYDACVDVEVDEGMEVWSD